MKRAPMVLFLSTLVLSSPRSAAADWLSLRDGGLLETKGPWQEKGKMERIDTDYCSRFDGTAAKNVCVMRAGIASELRKEEAARKAEADEETVTEPE